MKKIIMGLIIGCLLASTIPTMANVISYKLYKSMYSIEINGNKYKDTNYPVMQYKNKTYIPISALNKISTIVDNTNKIVKISNTDKVILKTGDIYKYDNFQIKLKEMRNNSNEKILIFEITHPEVIKYPNIVTDDMKFGLYKLNNTNQYSLIYNKYMKVEQPYIEIEGIKIIWNVSL
jgi:hypothetical protein